MSALASSLVDWSALWKIALAAVIGGCGVVIVFGIVLLSLAHARTASSRGARFAHWALAGTCSAMCVSAVAVGIYAMAQKPSSKPTRRPQPAALYRPVARRLTTP